MHSHDRTLLSRLGFADPDKKNSQHDLACQYLADREKVQSIVLMIAEKMQAPEESANSFDALMGTTYSAFEVPIEKGENQYKTTIGFVDLIIFASHHPLCAPNIFIEVKIEKISIGDCLRQLTLYDSYISKTYSWREFPWVLASPWPITAEEERMLWPRAMHVQLGDEFTSFCKNQVIAESPRI
jgi:hypothetical protein